MRGRPTSPEIRTAAVADYVAGMSSIEVAEKHSVSAKSVTEWVRAAGETVRRVGAPPTEQEIGLTGGGRVLDPVARIQRWVA